VSGLYRLKQWKESKATWQNNNHKETMYIFDLSQIQGHTHFVSTSKYCIHSVSFGLIEKNFGRNISYINEIVARLPEMKIGCTLSMITAAF
jgi:hypothetical protein